MLLEFERNRKKKGTAASTSVRPEEGSRKRARAGAQEAARARDARSSGRPGRSSLAAVSPQRRTLNPRQGRGGRGRGRSRGRPASQVTTSPYGSSDEDEVEDSDLEGDEEHSLPSLTPEGHNE